VYSLLLLAALPGQFVENPQFPNARQQGAYEATVRTYHPASRSYGTAVAVARRGPAVFFLTAAHLVPEKAVPGREKEDIKKVELYVYTAKSHPKLASLETAFVRARMPNEDLAVLEAVLPDFAGVVPICPKGRFQLRLPMAVMTVGGSPDGPPEIQFDTVKEKKLLHKPDKTSALYWEADIPQQIGRSGGPMIDAQGHVVGIASGTWHGKGYYTYINEMYRALANAGYAWLY
jgi:S1-C subfamily serine protease